MKKIVLTTAAIALLGVVGCQEKLDTLGGKVNSVAYMTASSGSITFPKETEGGETVVEPRLAAVADEDVRITLSTEDFLEKYNKTNKTEYRLLPNTEYELYEVGNPSNKSTNGKITTTIKAGQFSTKVGVRVRALDKEQFPIGVRYAIPLSISSATNGVLSNKSAVITFNRPVKTEVYQVKKGYSFGVALDETTPTMTEFTLQGQFMFLDFTNVNQTTMYGGYYTRIFPNRYQVKDGGGDGPETFVDYNFERGKWYQISHVYKGNTFSLYINGELVKQWERSGLGFGAGKNMAFAVFNNDTRYSVNNRVREMRLWNRALTKDEINDGLYTPVDPQSNGLMVYLPIDEKNKFNNLVTKYNHTVKFYTQGREIPAENFVEGGTILTKNVKFPAETLVIEN